MKKPSIIHITDLILISLLFVFILVSLEYKWWQAWLAVIIIGLLWLCINGLLSQSGVKVSKHERERRLKRLEISVRMEELAKCLEDDRPPDDALAVDTFQEVFYIIASDERLKGDFRYIWGDAWVKTDQFIKNEDGLDIILENDVKIREEMVNGTILIFMRNLFSCEPIRGVLIDIIRYGTGSIGTNVTLLTMNAHLAWMYTTEELPSFYRECITGSRSPLAQSNQEINNK